MKQLVITQSTPNEWVESWVRFAMMSDIDHKSSV